MIIIKHKKIKQDNILLIKNRNLMLLVSVALAFSLSVAISFEIFGESLDKQSYLRIFNEIQNYSSFTSLRYEPLFNWYVKIFQNLSFDPAYTFLWIVAPALLGKLYASYRVGGQTIVFLIIYGALWAPIFELNQIRTSLATGIFIFAIALPNMSVNYRAILAFVSVGFHYSMVAYVLVLWIIIFFSSKTAVIKKMLLTAIILFTLFYFDNQILESLMKRIELRNQYMGNEVVRLLSLFSIFILFSTSLISFYIIFLNQSEVPLLVQVAVISSIIGLTIFFYMAIAGGSFTYRILETMTIFLPISLAWLWSSTQSSALRCAILFLVIFSLAIAPMQWSRLTL